MTSTNTASATAPDTFREDIPLNQAGLKTPKWYKCHDDSLSGSKFVNVAFGTLTVVITAALLIQIYYGDYQVVPHGSVASDSLECSRAGTKILKEGGNAVDAAIACTLCLAVVTPHVTGLDAEGQMMIYNHRDRLPPTVINFSVSNTPTLKLPFLVSGLAYIHRQRGTLPWHDLVKPAADLAKNGYVVSKMLVQAVNKANAQHRYGRLEPGQLLSHQVLADTLATIANITKEDLYTNYIDSANEPVGSPAIKSTFYGYNIYVPGVETVGPALLDNLKEIEKYNFTDAAGAPVPQRFHALVDATLGTYKKFNLSTSFHQGTGSNVAVMDSDENYVSLVTGMYDLFGDKEQNEFVYVQDVKERPRPCSRIALIVTDNNFICGRRIVLGADNVAMATQLLANLVIGGQNVTEAIESARFHVMTDGTIGVEVARSPTFSESTVRYFEEITGNKVVAIDEPYNSSNSVEKWKDDLVSHSDSRGGGIASRF
ncbi:glutathione hydrolase 7-like isoform X2 [Cylas formicarius]|uniref:glutathione hydrolase 7-like isoform X2 n=1 Tax=Cylas formicarius TaxID=197179 RepID=UPI002958A949|nr:glutathione hydrolase 7-like isoform X2 [Cylas formicarius]